MWKTIVQRIVAGVCIGVISFAIQVVEARAGSLNLRDLLPNLLAEGLVLASPSGIGLDHSAHFLAGESNQVAAIDRLNVEMVRQIGSYPIASSAGGFSYRFDPSTGVLTRPTGSFGSSLMDRPFSLGEGRFNLGVHFSRFSFDTMDALNLRDGELALVLPHLDEDPAGSTEPFWEGDLVVGPLYMDLNTDVTTLFATFGARSNLDVGLVVPIVQTTLNMSFDARIERLATDPTDIHQFPDGTAQKSIQISGEAEGIGDILLRSKLVFREGTPDQFRAAVAGEIRFPTGDERNLLGAGSYQLKATLLGSRAWGNLSLRGQTGFLLATNSIPNEWQYAVGTDWVLDPKLTVAADILGRVIGDQRSVAVEDQTYSYQQGGTIDSADLPTVNVDSGGSVAHRADLGLGCKINVYRTVLLSATGVIPIDRSGLVDSFWALLGLDFSY